MCIRDRCLELIGGLSVGRSSIIAGREAPTGGIIATGVAPPGTVTDPETQTFLRDRFNLRGEINVGVDTIVKPVVIAGSMEDPTDTDVVQPPELASRWKAYTFWFTSDDGSIAHRGLDFGYGLAGAALPSRPRYLEFLGCGMSLPSGGTFSQSGSVSLVRQETVHSSYSNIDIKVVRGSPRSTDQGFDARLVDGFNPTLPSSTTGLWLWGGSTDPDNPQTLVDPRSPLVAYSGGASHSDRVFTIFHTAGANSTSGQQTQYFFYVREWT